MPRRAQPGTRDLFGKRQRLPDLEPLEEPIHISILHYLEATLPGDFEVHHSPNGGMLKGIVAKQKRMGMKPGWPDLEIVGYTRDGSFFFGMIEVKRHDGTLQPSQEERHPRLRDLGVPVFICRSIDDARAFVGACNLPSLDVRVNYGDKETQDRT